MAECWFNCTNPNYFGMPVMIFPSAADGGGWDSMLVDGNMSYAADDGSMLTPDYPWVWIESSLGSDPTNITMWCNEFDIADIGSTPSDPTDPNTFYLNSYANFIDFQLSINYTLQYFDYWPDDNRNPFLARLIPIEYYSINGLRLNSNFQPISPTNPIVNSRLDCPSGWYYGTVAEKCYYFGFQDVEWGINADLCPGSSTLVSIDSAFENNEIQSLGRALSRCAGGFIGLTTWGVPGVTTWHWGNNDSSPYRNWKQGYPINDNVYPGWATCAVMEWSSGKWMNDDCNIGRCYICQMSKGLFLEKAHKRQKDGQQNERAMNKRFARYHQKMNKD
uniref:C-type lectin domain-containing protein n=1 Tax=Acrobeloides nanus TaxID=290746 RepID=A0A914DSP7_9BILA